MVSCWIVFISIVLCLSCASNSSKNNTCKEQPFDIVFLIDTSRSIWHPTFESQVKFIKDVAEQFDIGPGPEQTRIGVVSFGDTYYLQFHLWKNNRKDLLEQALLRMRHKVSKSTNTAAALRFMRKYMFTRRYGSRKYATHVAVVITDGKSQNRKATLEAAKAARESGIEIFAFGVGDAIDIRELDNIASRPTSDFVYEVADFQSLDAMKFVLANRTCKGNVQFRLVNGTRTSGRLEVNYGGTWGTICDLHFDTNAAKVACKTLKMPYQAALPVSSNSFGAGTGPIWIDYLHCIGNETSIIQCQTEAFGYCRHRNDVGVICTSSLFGVNVDYRLAGGPSASAGRLEIRHDGMWGTVCDRYFNNYAAKLVCDALGISYQTALPIYSGSFGTGTGPIWLNYVDCFGNETSIFQCRTKTPFYLYCSHRRDVGVICLNSSLEANVAYRLAGGPSASAGRLEIRLGGIWGTVCENNLKNYAAKLVCDALGVSYQTALPVTAGYFGAGTGPIWFGDIDCFGNEVSIIQCPNMAARFHYCSHREDVGVICTNSSLGGNVSFRLAGGPSASAGRLEIRLDGMWGTVCDYDFNNYAAKLVCDALEVSYQTARPIFSGSFGAGTGPVWFDSLHCFGNETSINQCQTKAATYSYCSHGKDVSVICTNSSLEANIAYRLVGGPIESAGRLEIRLDGLWGTVCDFRFSNYAAKLVCDALGVSYQTAIPISRNFFGAGTGPNWFDFLHCFGNETSIIQCQNKNFRYYDCNRNDVGVICTSSSFGANVTYRLAGGPNASGGRLEIRLDGIWGTVCNDLNNYAAELICDALGEPYQTALPVSAGSYGAGRGPIWFVDLHCFGNETSIIQCQNKNARYHACHHGKDVGVICTNSSLGANVAYRLVGGPSETTGRLEIRLGGIWGTVCDDIDSYAAKLVCDALGVSYQTALPVSAGGFGAGTGPIWFIDLHCFGNETSIIQCQSKSAGDHACYHRKDVGVICTSSSLEASVSYRLAGGPSESAGRLEIRLGGIWGTVCDDFDNYAAKLVCDALGVSYHTALPISQSSFGAGTGPIWFDDLHCFGNETSIIQCQTKAAGDCHYGRDVGVICTSSSLEAIEAYRLVGGPSTSTGRLEIRLGGIWGTVCDRNFNNYAAKLVCDALGISYAKAMVQRGRKYGYGRGPIWLHDVTCSGNETSILHCRHKPFGIGVCSHYMDVGIMCATVALGESTVSPATKSINIG